MIITVDGLDAARAGLDKLLVKERFTRAIRLALRAGKAHGSGRVKSRYTAKNPLSLGSIRIRASGMQGEMRISGARNLIKKFRLSPSTRPPHNPPGGLFVQIVHGQGGWLRHAFLGMKRPGVYERTSKKKYPIKRLNTLSLAGMFSYFGDEISNEMLKRLEAEIGG